MENADRTKMALQGVDVVSQECWKSLLKSLSDDLRPLGFARSGDFFTRHWPDGNIGFVSLFKERQKGETPGRFSVTMEFAVASKVCLERFQNFLAYPEKPHPACTHLSERIGYLCGKECDYWWELDSESFLSTYDQLRRAMFDFGLPFMEREVSDRAICARRLGGFMEDRNVSPAEFCILVYLLRHLGDKSNFDMVAEYGFEKLGPRPFEEQTIASFLIDLGFERAGDCHLSAREKNPYLRMSKHLQPGAIVTRLPGRDDR